ncbi:MAG: hypothetical protein HYZ29_25935 [Myxococcales bacterium]|nr:hypothetical protein [Myxococcales bacterium]
MTAADARRVRDFAPPPIRRDHKAIAGWWADLPEHRDAAEGVRYGLASRLLGLLHLVSSPTTSREVRALCRLIAALNRP